MIHIDMPISPAIARDVNVTHGNMALHIAQAYPHSEALQEVATAQYADLLAKLQRAMDNVIKVQHRTVELATGNAVIPEFERFKDELGL